MTQSIAEVALAMVPNGAILGLGTGHAATAFVQALGAGVQKGLQVWGVPTSQATAELARHLGIPLLSLSDVDALDMAFDGADEVDPQGNLIKGYGGALVRERIVAASAKKFVVLVGPEKLVPVLGSRGRLPIEVVPFGVPLVKCRLKGLGMEADFRLHDDKPFVSDNGNWILDALVQPLPRPQTMDEAIRNIPGVVGTGIFLAMAHQVLIQHPDRVEIRSPSDKR